MSAELAKRGWSVEEQTTSCTARRKHENERESNPQVSRSQGFLLVRTDERGAKWFMGGGDLRPRRDGANAMRFESRDEALVAARALLEPPQPPAGKPQPRALAVVDVSISVPISVIRPPSSFLPRQLSLSPRELTTVYRLSSALAARHVEVDGRPVVAFVDSLVWLIRRLEHASGD
jgi:hypothetical protein